MTLLDGGGAAEELACAAEVDNSPAMEDVAEAGTVVATPPIVVTTSEADDAAEEASDAETNFKSFSKWTKENIWAL